MYPRSFVKSQHVNTIRLGYFLWRGEVLPKHPSAKVSQHSLSLTLNSPTRSKRPSSAQTRARREHIETVLLGADVITRNA